MAPNEVPDLIKFHNLMRIGSNYWFVYSFRNTPVAFLEFELTGRVKAPLVLYSLTRDLDATCLTAAMFADLGLFKWATCICRLVESRSSSYWVSWDIKVPIYFPVVVAAACFAFLDFTLSKLSSSSSIFSEPNRPMSPLSSLMKFDLLSSSRPTSSRLGRSYKCYWSSSMTLTAPAISPLLYLLSWIGSSKVPFVWFSSTCLSSWV